MRDRGAETSGVLDYCLRHQIAFIAHGALGGLDARRGKKDIARSFPRLKKVAEEKKVSTHAAALALMRHRWPNLIHITGSSTCALLSCVHV
jgi:diketogulonate reductase-like aldo/keto reductase